MEYKTVLALLISILVGGSFALFMRKEIAKLHLFFLLQSMLSLSTSGASFYFYTDTEEQFPGGPHFSILFYTTYIGIIHAIFGFIGISLYNRFGREWSYNKLIKFSGLVSIITTTLRVILFSRFNKRVGIHDELIMGTSVAISSVMSEFTWLGLSILISQSCPDSCETSLISLTSGCLNIGSDIGSILGAGMLHLASITPSGSINEDKEFDNLWVCVLISGLLPCILLPFLKYLLPGSTPCEPLILVDSNDPCFNSPWRKLRLYFRL